jgi:hypothetical protein
LRQRDRIYAVSWMLTETEFRHGLLDPHVKRRRIKFYGRGVYVDVEMLLSALRERGHHLDDSELDRYVRALGGQRLQRGTWLARILPLDSLPRRAEYFLPELAFHRIRQRR